jgi:transposase
MAASNHQTSKQGSAHRHRPELRERAVRMVEETMKETGERHGVVTRTAVQLGLGSETLRHWVKQAEIDKGERPGVTTQDQQRIAELEKENRELRRANEILKAASAFFASGSSTCDHRDRMIASRAVPLPIKMPSQRSDLRRVPAGSGGASPCCRSRLRRVARGGRGTSDSQPNWPHRAPS